MTTNKNNSTQERSLKYSSNYFIFIDGFGVFKVMMI